MIGSVQISYRIVRSDDHHWWASEPIEKVVPKLPRKGDFVELYDDDANLHYFEVQFVKFCEVDGYDQWPEVFIRGTSQKDKEMLAWLQNAPGYRCNFT